MIVRASRRLSLQLISEEFAEWLEVGHTWLARAYWLLTGFAVTFMTARMLGPTGRGVAAAAVTSVQFFALLAHLSIPNVIFFVASGIQPQRWLPRVAGTAFALAGASTLLAWIAAAGLYLATDGSVFSHISVRILIIAFLSLPFFILAEGVNALLTAAGSLRRANLLQIVAATTSLVFTISVLILFSRSVTAAVVAIVSYQVCMATMGAAAVLSKARRLEWSSAEAKTMLHGAIRLHPSAIATYMLLQANILIINYYGTAAQTAYYQLCVQLISAIQVLPAAISSVTYQMATAVGVDRAWPRQRTLLFGGVLIMTAMAGLAYLAGPIIILRFAGQSFGPAVPIFRILLLSVIGATVSAIMASQWIARGLFMQVSTISILLAAATVTANLLVVPRFGLTGAAWITVGTYTLAMLINLSLAFWVDARYRRLAASSET